jgi:hypothetical protein
MDYQVYQEIKERGDSLVLLLKENKVIIPFIQPTANHKTN